MEEKVKGTVMVNFVRALKKAKDEKMFAYLNEEDRKIIAGTIFPGGWYPAETFFRCITAVYEVMGEKKVENAKSWGRAFGAELLGGTYKDIVSGGNVQEALKNYSLLSKSFLTGCGLSLESVGEKGAALSAPRITDHPALEIFFLLHCGGIEACAEMAGAKNPRVDLADLAPEGKKGVRFKVRWD